MKTRIITIMLVFSMCLSLMPLMATAADGADTSGKITIESFEFTGFEALIEGDFPNNGVICGGWTSLPGVYSASNYGEQYDSKFIKRTAGGWVDLADGEKIVADGTTHYGYKFYLRIDSGYAFTENTKLIYNGTDVSDTGMVTMEDLVGGFKVLYIDLGLAKESVDVTFEVNGGDFDISCANRSHERISGNTLTLAKGTKIDEDMYDPEMDGNYFAGWYTDAGLTNAFNVKNTPIEKDMTLYAKYAPLTYIKNVDLSFDMFKKGTKIMLKDMEIDGDICPLPMPTLTVKTPVGANYSIYKYIAGVSTLWVDPKDTRDLIFEPFTISENTDYAIKFIVTPQKNYAFTENAVLTVNGKPYEPSLFSKNYIEVDYIFKTTKEHRLTWDMNGGSIDYYNPPTKIWEDVPLDLGQINKDNIQAPAGTEFDAFEINGKKADIGEYITITEGSVIKLLWKTIAAPAYTIIDGANAVWTKNTGRTLTFRANGDFSVFTGVKVDDTLLVADKYTAVSGSTVVTLNADFLDSLSVGKHKLTIVYNDGECSTNFEIKSADNTNLDSSKPNDNGKPTDTSANTDAEKSPQTGDNSRLSLWFALLIISALFVAGVVIFGNRKKAK